MAKAKSYDANLARAMFEYGYAYHEAAVILGPQNKCVARGKSIPYRNAAKVIPTAVCAAIATEIYLKCLVLIDTGTAARGHDLNRLFELLTPGMRSAIGVSYNDAHKQVTYQIPPGASNRAFGLDHALTMASKVFEKMRYAYEKPNDVLSIFPVLPYALQQTIVAINPDWKPPEPLNPTPPTSQSH